MRGKSPPSVLIFRDNQVEQLFTFFFKNLKSHQCRLEENKTISILRGKSTPLELIFRDNQVEQLF